jgi:hypothetical protein
LIKTTLAGCEIRPRALTEPGQTEPFEPQRYETELIPDAFAWEDWALTETDLQGEAAWEAAMGNTAPGVLTKRDSVFTALGFATTDRGFGASLS